MAFLGYLNRRERCIGGIFRDFAFACRFNPGISPGIRLVVYDDLYWIMDIQVEINGRMSFPPAAEKTPAQLECAFLK